VSAKVQALSKILSAKESDRLQVCEAIVEKGLRTFVEVGSALAEIRAKKLYRQDYDTFEDYCRNRWQMVASRARQLIGAAEVVHNLQEQSVTRVTLPTTEKQVRPLLSLPAQQRREVWEAAVAASKNGNPTATEVERALQTLCGKLYTAKPTAAEAQSINGGGLQTITFDTIVAEMSIEDILYGFGHTYVYKACELIEQNAETEQRRQALIAFLLNDSIQRTNEIRNYFALKPETASGTTETVS
jgi:hypothetical protein